MEIKANDIKRIEDTDPEVADFIAWWCNGGSNGRRLNIGTNDMSVRGRDRLWRSVGTVDKAGRNDPCPCLSGKKYKKCCGGN